MKKKLLPKNTSRIPFHSFDARLPRESDTHGWAEIGRQVLRHLFGPIFQKKKRKWRKYANVKQQFKWNRKLIDIFVLPPQSHRPLTNRKEKKISENNTFVSKSFFQWSECLNVCLFDSCPVENTKDVERAQGKKNSLKLQCSMFNAQYFIRKWRKTSDSQTMNKFMKMWVSESESVSSKIKVTNSL